MTTMLPQLRTKAAQCAGCRDDHYNHGDNSSTGCCWLLEKARLRWRWAINMQTPMDTRDRFRRVRVYGCFHGSGPYRDIYLKQLPHHLGAEWADKAEQREPTP